MWMIFGFLCGQSRKMNGKMHSNMCPERYSFKANWFQKEAEMCRPFVINVFPKDNSVEIFDERSRKMFLRRSPLDTLNGVNHEGSTWKQFYVGAKLNLFGRQFNITDYADDVTKFKLSSHRESAFCLLKSHAIPFLDKILNQFRDERFTIGHCKMVQLDRDCASRLFMQEMGDIKPTLPDLVESITGGPVLVLELFGQNANRKLLDVLGPDDPDDAKEFCPNSIRAKYGTSLMKNVALCSKSTELAEMNIRYFFAENQIEPCVTMNGTLGIVKPHAVLDGKLGDIISVIYENDFKVTAMKMMNMERGNCEEFLEVYKGVVPEYNKMVLELISGPTVGLEIMSCDSQIESQKKSHCDFRNLCGPADPEIAKRIRPKSIRAKFGTNLIQNAIHCTDLPDDVELELSRFFKIFK